MKKIILTKYDNKILYMLLVDNKEIEIELIDDENTSILGNIYVGRVRDIVKNIDAAFVEIAPDTVCYFSLAEEKTIFLNNKNTDKVCQGDLILVQVSKEAVKTKAPVVTSQINLPGKYIALTRESKGVVGISKKITNIERAGELKNLMQEYVSGEYGIVVRTEAEAAANEEIISEVYALTQEYHRMLEIARTRKRFTVMKKAENPIYKYIKNAMLDFGENSEDIIITDDIEIYGELVGKYDNIKLYEDSEISLNRCYSIENRIKNALNKNVWLKSGGYLVIEPTEALTVIDVNTGKFDKKSEDREATFLKINLEAAREIARQLRIRNLSGIIIIDFINMKNKDNIELLIKELEKLIRLDPVTTRFFDYTKLGLVEITRQKIRRPLHEAFPN